MKIYILLGKITGLQGIINFNWTQLVFFVGNCLEIKRKTFSVNLISIQLNFYSSFAERYFGYPSDIQIAMKRKGTNVLFILWYCDSQKYSLDTLWKM